MVAKGQKARRAMVFGLNGVLNPVKRNCDEAQITTGLVSYNDTMRINNKIRTQRISSYPYLLILSKAVT